MKVIKRDGREIPFDRGKIEAAIAGANTSVSDVDRLSADEIGKIVDEVVKACESLGRAANVEEIQDFVISNLAKAGHIHITLSYSEYRLRHEIQRNRNTTDAKVLSLLRRKNEIAIQENSNKNPILNSTLRDYLASEVSEDICRRYIFPEEIIKAHDEGILHIHDMGYISGPITNCELVNLEDMLQNGTVISGTKIEKPHSFRTACNVATQIIALVASSSFGGQTISLAHLAPFIDVSRQWYRKDVLEQLQAVGLPATEENVNQIAEMRLRKEIRDGVQMIQYQINTLTTCNGQTPFVSVFMYLNEVPEGQTRDDLALIIEEMLNQRIQGVKNEVGEWITNLVKVKFGGNIKNMNSNPFPSCTKLEALVLSGITAVPSISASNWSSTNFAKGSAYFYVPSSLVNNIKVTSGWSTFADQIRAIEDYQDFCNF